MKDILTYRHIYQALVGRSEHSNEDISPPPP